MFTLGFACHLNLVVCVKKAQVPRSLQTCYALVQVFQGVWGSRGLITSFLYTRVASCHCATLWVNGGNGPLFGRTGFGLLLFACLVFSCCELLSGYRWMWSAPNQDGYNVLLLAAYVRRHLCYYDRHYRRHNHASLTSSPPASPSSSSASSLSSLSSASGSAPSPLPLPSPSSSASSSSSS